MAKPSQDEIDKQLKKQDDDVYGDAYVDGDPDKFSDTGEMIEDVTGNEPDDTKPYSIAKEELEDAKDIRDDKPEDKEEEEIEEIESDIERIEKEKRKEDTSA